MLAQCVSFVTLIFFNVYAVDWKTVQAHRKLPDIPPDNCTIGEYYKSNCNVCECISPGAPKCGNLRCADDVGVPERSSNATKDGCVVGTVYRDWCNLCRCEDGNYGACTRMRCRPS